MNIIYADALQSKQAPKPRELTGRQWRRLQAREQVTLDRKARQRRLRREFAEHHQHQNAIGGARVLRGTVACNDHVLLNVLRHTQAMAEALAARDDMTIEVALKQVKDRLRELLK